VHELSVKDARKYFAEARRVLRPGGLFLTMELPPNRLLALYDQFYLDWDCYYNREPFYRAFRDADAVQLAASAGFDPATYFHFTVPQYFRTPPQQFRQWIERQTEFSAETGRLSDDIHYFAFGFWK
jgi:ubiquinone/menaquinone biosynthesis C-methylase UbiE